MRAHTLFMPYTTTAVIHEAAMGLRFHARVDDFVELLHVYPTMAEAFKIAIHLTPQRSGKALLLRRVIFFSESAPAEARALTLEGAVGSLYRDGLS